MIFYCMLEHKVFPTFNCNNMGQCRQCERYEKGEFPPRFPVPVIKQEFDYVQNLNTGEVALIHVVYGAFNV